ncbi:metallo-beta-lactamase domain protein [Marvinbryantia formatexigens DSM 14469]|uniref:Metallo-beta-lactamase domain protein n=1 Tax=Marvinbryantia formatexigens DSM 14469 TaxID=478749 RepID=C6LAH8_9FIRM|nr:MBL fold metallo-hydrolase [Marvinbryantia formatexigens]EET62585.1 metallo-beta-lactamase domain protein [Marvinbryantia formatexigens DSM 14469]UWO23259.1 MBL fold metallo-hydrolase [Marvinbryantia formatexigens DSM 14469]SDG61358.1 Beta-lactamase superfamily domain-containing protein [Marvinbryantia formatexigens]
MERIRFLGCGSAFNPLLGNTSAYFIMEDSLVLIDAGETVFSKLYKMKLLESCPEIFIIITHTHSDHVGSLPSIISYTYYVLGKRVNIFYPEKSLAVLLDMMGIVREAYVLSVDRDFCIGSVAVHALSVKHEENIGCYGYLLEFPDAKIYYSGDSYEIPDRVIKGFLAGEIKKIYQDTTEYETERLSHCPLSMLESLFPVQMRKNIYCMHFSNDFMKKLEEKGFNYVKVEET